MAEEYKDSEDKNLKAAILCSIGLEHALESAREYIYTQSIRKHERELSRIGTLGLFCNTKKDKKNYLSLEKDAKAEIKKYEGLFSKNRSSKYISNMFGRVNQYAKKETVKLLEEETHDLYSEFSELLTDLIQHKDHLTLKSAVLVEDKDGNFKHKNKTYKVVAK